MSGSTSPSRKSKIYSIRLTEDQARTIAEIARRETRTVSNTIYSIVVNYLNSLEQTEDLADER